MGNIICMKKRRCRPFAIPLAAGVLYQAGILLTPAVGALLMSLSTVIVAVNAGFLKIEK